MSRFLVLLLALVVGPSALAAESLTMKEWLNVFIDTCVGGGSSFSASGSLDAGIGFSLKKLLIFP